MLNQSFRQVFVTNSSALLASGKTVEGLPVGGIGILDAKTHAATTTPTYANNKALEIVWGTPNLTGLPIMSGVINQNEYSKLIKGRLLKNFRGHAAKRGQTQLVSIGFSGDVSDTDTLFSKPGEVKNLYIKLTGSSIDKLYSKQGVVRQYSSSVGTVDDCTDPCVNVDCRKIADDLVAQINADAYINKFIKASSVISCSPALDAPTTDTDYKFRLVVCDTRDDVSLGIVQSQYPNDTVTRTGSQGSASIYEVTRDTNSLPTAFSNAGVVLVPDCATCPSGYTLSDDKYAYKVLRADAGTSGAKTTLNTDYGIVSPETSSRLVYEYGQSTYVILSDTTVSAAVAQDTLEFLGVTRNTCVLTTPTTVAWETNGTVVKYTKKYRITLADDICGNNRLTALQAAFPALTIAVVNAGGSCIHTYETTVYSNPIVDGCSIEDLKFLKPQAFGGIEWFDVAEAALPDGTTCKCGILLEVAFVNRLTNECTFDYFPYDSDTIYVDVSNFNPDYNASPNEAQWVTKKLRGAQFAAGFGSYVRELEKESKGYDLRDRSFDPVLREIQGYSFQAKADTYYDEYVLEFDFSYKVGGWSEHYTDSYHLHVFFPEGAGKNFEAAINGYISSAALNIDPVVL